MKRLNLSMQFARRTFQVAIIIALTVTGYRYATGVSRISIETFCPFGGLETAYALLTNGQFTCTTGERNLALFLGLLVLTLIARKAFCSWVCPIGAISEWASAIGKKLFPKHRRDASGERLHALEPPRRVDQKLRWLRLLVLSVILFFTYKTGELIFRGYDPFYILFSFNGHDVQSWSYLILAVVLLGVVVFPMAWCRYLCPLGAALWPVSRIAAFRLTRVTADCTSCGACNRSCPQALDLLKTDQVTSGDCTLCLKCIQACPKNTLELRCAGRVPYITIPLLLVGITVVSLWSAQLFAIPTLTVEYATPPSGADIVTTQMVVQGVKCRDTAQTASDALIDVPGILTCVAYASHNRIEISYEPAGITDQDIKNLIEGPIFDEATGEFVFNRFTVLTINGEDAVSSSRQQH